MSSSGQAGVVTAIYRAVLDNERAGVLRISPTAGLSLVATTTGQIWWLPRARREPAGPGSWYVGWLYFMLLYGRHETPGMLRL
jgi:hypothetical protein